MRSGSAFVLILIVGQPECLRFPLTAEVLAWVTVPDLVRRAFGRAELADPAAEADPDGTVEAGCLR